MRINIKQPVGTIDISEVCPRTHIIAMLCYDRVSVLTCTDGLWRFAILDSESLQTGNCYNGHENAKDWQALIHQVETCYRTFHAFDSPVTFFKWAATVA